MEENEHNRTVIQDNKLNENVNENNDGAGGFQQADNEMNILIYHTNTNSNHTAAFHFMDAEAQYQQENTGTAESAKSSPDFSDAEGHEIVIQNDHK